MVEGLRLTTEEVMGKGRWVPVLKTSGEGPKVFIRLDSPYVEYFMDLWYITDKASYMEAYKAMDSLEGSMWAWLHDNNLHLFQVCDAKAKERVMRKRQGREEVEDEDTTESNSGQRMSKEDFKASLPEIGNIKVLQVGEDWVATGKAGDQDVVGTGKSANQAVFLMFNEARAIGKFQYPKGYGKSSK